MTDTWIKSDDAQIFIIEDNNLNQFNSKLKSEIIRVGDCQNRQSNVKAQMTNWNMFEESDVFVEFAFWSLKAFENLPFVGGSYYPLRFTVSNLWGMIYREGDYTLGHCHMPYFYSFVHYVECTDNAPPLVFTKSQHVVECKSGTTVFFPSHLTHSVDKLKENDVRIAVSGNISCIS